MCVVCVARDMSVEILTDPISLRLNVRVSVFVCICVFTSVCVCVYARAHCVLV